MCSDEGYRWVVPWMASGPLACPESVLGIAVDVVDDGDFKWRRAAFELEAELVMHCFEHAWALRLGGAVGCRCGGLAGRQRELDGEVVTASEAGLVYNRAAETAERNQHVEWTYHSAPMASLASQITVGDRPVVDRTGLPGKYQFVLKRIDLTPEQNGLVSSDESNPANVFGLNALGLRLEPIKLPSEKIVIDHIERPSED